VERLLKNRFLNQEPILKNLPNFCLLDNEKLIELFDFVFQFIKAFRCNVTKHPSNLLEVYFLLLLIEWNEHLTQQIYLLVVLIFVKFILYYSSNFAINLCYFLIDANLEVMESS
jgi:hypothetical protein